MPGIDGRFLWFELLTEDVDKAVDFYTSVVGWGTRPWEGETSGYILWTAGDEPVGGVMKLPSEAKQSGMPPYWMGYVGANDITSTLNKVRGMGGEVLVPPQLIPDVGTFGVLKDPQGAVIAAMTPATEMPPSMEMRSGHTSWCELLTTDPDGAWRFYEALFGWEKTESMDMGEYGIYQMFGLGGQSMGGFFARPEITSAPNLWLYYFTVDDIDAALKAVNTNGGELVHGPMEVPGGDRIAQCKDSQGAWFALHAKKK